MATAAATMRLKLLIDTEGQRVLCAEASNDFVDFLFNILLLPVGTVIRLLTKQGMVGSIGNLYKSVENLSAAYLQPQANKDTLLKPKSSASFGLDGINNVPLLSPNTQPSTTRFYHCPNVSSGTYSNCRGYCTNDSTSTCPYCGKFMNLPATFVNPLNKAVPPSSGTNIGGAYVKGGVVTYTIMDDLTVTPMSTISSIVMLKKFNVKQIDSLEEQVVDVGMNEAVALLKASLVSKTVLSDVFLNSKGLEEAI